MVRKLVQTALTAALIASAALPLYAQEEEGLEGWYTDVDKAVEAAKAEGKLILVDLYTDWCGWCKKLDQDTYSDAKVKAELAKVVALKINPEKNPFGKELMKKSGARGYPANAIFDADWNLVVLIAGYKPPEAYTETLSKALKSWDDYNALKATFEKGGMEYADLYKYMSACRELGRKEGLLKAGTDLLGMEKGEHHAEAAFYMAKAHDNGSEDYIKYKEMCLKYDPENATGHFDDFVIDEAIAVANKGKTPDEMKVQLPLARKILEDRLAAESPRLDKEKGQIMYWVLFQMYFDKGRGDLDKALESLEKGHEMLPDSEMGRHMKATHEKLSKE